MTIFVIGIDSEGRCTAVDYDFNKLSTIKLSGTF